MINSEYVDTLIQNDEVVIYDIELGKTIHKELFKLKDNAYININLIGKIDPSYAQLRIDQVSFFDAITILINVLNHNNSKHPANLQILLEWAHMIQLAVWCFDSRLAKKVYIFLSNIGIDFDKVNLIEDDKVHSIFKYLLVNARFDVFRKVCHYAKRNLEECLNNKSIQIICHLASSETRTILASSL